MERTTSMIIFGLITLIAGGIIISVASDLTADSPSWCSDDPLCSENGEKYCSSNEQVSCFLDERGCLVSEKVVCENGCSEGVCE